MQTILIVTLLIGQSALAEKLSWSQKVTQLQSQKSLEAICKSASDRIQKKICKSIKKEDLQDKTKVKITLEDRGTAHIKYKEGKIKLRRTDESHTLLVNRKALYLDEIASFQDLKKKLIKLAGEENTEAAIPALLYLYRTAEQEACLKADAVVKSCVKGKQERAIEQSTDFNAVISYLSPSKKEALEMCQCEQKLCGFAKKANLGLKKDYELCVKQTKELVKQAKKEKRDDEGLKEFSQAILTLHKKEKPRQPALFKEDSYKE